MSTMSSFTEQHLDLANDEIVETKPLALEAGGERIYERELSQVAAFCVDASLKSVIESFPQLAPALDRPAVHVVPKWREAAPLNELGEDVGFPEVLAVRDTNRVVGVQAERRAIERPEGEVDEASGSKDAVGFGQRGLWVSDVLKDVVGKDHVHGVGGQRQVGRVSFDEGNFLCPPVPRVFQIDTYHPLAEYGEEGSGHSVVRPDLEEIPRGRWDELDELFGAFAPALLKRERVVSVITAADSVVPLQALQIRRTKPFRFRWCKGERELRPADLRGVPESVVGASCSDVDGLRQPLASEGLEHATDFATRGAYP